MAKIKPSAYIPTLDGWRAMAITLVIGAHCAPMLINSGTPLGLTFASLLEHAGYGVDVFFSLSGYLICTLLLQEKSRFGTINLKGFYSRRFFRILPPIAAYLLGLAVMTRFGWLPGITITDFLRTVLFVRNYFEGSWYTGHFWSLAIEEQFYLIVPVILMLGSRKNVLRLALVLIAICVLTRWVEMSYMTSTEGPLQFRTENRIDGLLWGGVLALVLQDEAVRIKIARWLTARTAGAALILAVVLLNVFPQQAVRRTIVALAMPILIGHSVLNPYTTWASLLELPVIRWIGRLSYSLYIWQQLFLPPADRPLGVIQTFPLALLATLGCAICSYTLIERPMIRLGHNFASLWFSSSRARRYS